MFQWHEISFQFQENVNFVLILYIPTRNMLQWHDTSFQFQENATFVFYSNCCVKFWVAVGYMGFLCCWPLFSLATSEGQDLFCYADLVY
jgi:hypothetical protein